MPTVLVYRSALLAGSETFIKAQVQGCRRWRAILVGRRLCHQLPLEGLDVRLLESESVSRSGRVLSTLRRALGRVPDLSPLGRDAPDLVHVHFGVDAVEAAPIAVALGVPLVVTLHGFDISIDPQWWRSGKGGWLKRRYPDQLLSLARRPDVHFIAVSKPIRERALAFGIPADKVHVRHIGVDRTLFRPGTIPIAERPRRVLFVGRLVEKKGCEYLLRAMKLIAGTTHAELSIIGDGPLMPALKSLAQSLGVVARFMGARSSAEVREQFGLARVLSVPSVTAANGDAEGLPIALLEAQASGLPVVTSAAGMAEEGICAETGFFVAERDVDALAARLSDLLIDDALAQRMSAAGPPWVASRFDLSSCTASLERFYDTLM